MRRGLVGGREALCQREAGLTPAEERGREDERKGGRLSRSALVRRAALRKFQKFNGPCLRTCSVVSNSLLPHRLCSPEAPLCVGFSQARVWVAVAVVDFFAMSCPTLATPRTVARRAPLSMGFSRQEHGSGLPFPPPGNPPDPAIKPMPALAGGFSTTEPPGKLLSGPN